MGYVRAEPGRRYGPGVSAQCALDGLFVILATQLENEGTTVVPSFDFDSLKITICALATLPSKFM